MLYTMLWYLIILWYRRFEIIEEKQVLQRIYVDRHFISKNSKCLKNTNRKVIKSFIAKYLANSVTIYRLEVLTDNTMPQFTEQVMLLIHKCRTIEIWSWILKKKRGHFYLWSFIIKVIEEQQHFNRFDSFWEKPLKIIPEYVG